MEVEDDATPTESSEIPPGSEAPPGDEVPPGEDADAEAKKMMEDESEMAAIREKIIETRKVVFQMNEQEVSRRWTFEEGICRPYFHVKPLEKVQLKNWRDYLDMEIENGSHERTVILFERCLIACAMYEEFWMKYAKYLEGCDPETAESIYRKACTIFLRKKPAIHLAWAAFEEKRGNFAAADEILQEFEKEMPKLVMIQLRHITLARRQGDFEKVDQLYGKYMEEAASEKEQSFFAIKRARYQAKVLHNVEAARETLELAINKDEVNEKLYLQLLDLEYQQKDMDEMRINALFENAVSKLEPDHKVAFSRRRMEFMEDFGCNVLSVQQAYEAHQKLLKELNAQSGRKRKPEDGSGDDAQNDKKARYDSKQYSNGSSDYSSSYMASHSQGAYGGYGMPSHHGYYDPSWNTGFNSMSYGYHQNQWGPYSGQYYGSQ
ncbi:hypothetical protein LSH36_264g01031 [Paralvinella palmiformis]|uniref:Pre-mRNA-processing factor 39 n=1 Tax=Paralvinella palmiformis TaxID=53620 RepID=A0AAD9N524_9ANNE|nr:hypothetical protein LSH36_264g01031 [Paralvinella palmiformis]